MAADRPYEYVIIGGGLAGASAIQGIREKDPDGSILLACAEKHLPYNRPPLTKQLWTGKKKLVEIFVNSPEFYRKSRADVMLGTKIVSIDAASHTVTDTQEISYAYRKLLLATGGAPQMLNIPGGDTDGLCYFRYLDDYLQVREEAAKGKSAVVIGGGFIGSEIAAALSLNGVFVTMVFPEPYLCSRVFPEALGRAIQDRYIEKGVDIVSGDRPALIEKREGRFVTQTGRGRQIETDIAIAGIGIKPSLGLAQKAGLRTADGIEVDEFLQTSDPDIFAAGDNALFPYHALGKRMRVEHWDNALNQGKQAGRNMAGRREPYTYMPYFFSDLFEFGYEAVGEVSTESLETWADWQKENDTGVVYYIKDGKIRGALMCNIWGKLDEARKLILEGGRITHESLKGAIV
ncbi:MAG: FAD/NAD(P)-binding oxidoreductase [Nitrospiraceae bacterium]|nr:FAD/NAD(P)-binding oxidoreductase [Nitrospiraceae bacterium]